MRYNFAIWCLLLIGAGTATAQVQIQLSVDPERGLPGIPPSLRVMVRNTGSTPVAVPWNVALRVTAGDQPPFYAVQGPRGISHEIELPLLGEHPEVPAGQSIDVTMWASGEHSPTWFIADPRLTKPGTYRIQLVCGITLDEDHRPHQPEPFATSNETTYTVLEPSGVDALAWNHIRSSGWPWYEQLGEDIWASWPTSRYAAYYLPPRDAATNYAKAIAARERAIQMRPDRIYVQAHQMTLAYLYASRINNAIEKFDVGGAQAAADRSRALYSGLSRDALDPDVREYAARKLEELPTQKDIVNSIRLLSGETIEVIPYAECVERRTDGNTYIWFGYQNSNRAPITVPIGQQNRITPAPFDRGQPTTFRNTMVHLAFAVKADAPQLTWHLQGETAHAKVADMIPCPADLLPSQ